MYKALLKPLFFLLTPERAHQLALVLLKLTLGIPGMSYLFRRVYRLPDKRLQRRILGLTFPNPVGLAAGFDKDGRHFRAMAALGFGFIEVGTVTPQGQRGNPRPRLFRLPKDEALINRMGFNNEGMAALAKRLRRGRPKNLIIGGNIGKNKTTPNERAIDDYAACFETLFPYVDYFVVNVSSPNTPGLRALQEKAPLTHLLSRLQELNQQKPQPKPILLKIAPDLSQSQLDDVLDIVRATGVHGIVATNTTVSREGLRDDAARIAQIGEGGLSGRPVRQRATEIIRYLHERSGGNLTIIGVGGIASPADALEKLRAGADLIQIYTGLVYEGPGLVRRINQAIISSEETM